MSEAMAPASAAMRNDFIKNSPHMVDPESTHSPWSSQMGREPHCEGTAAAKPQSCRTVNQDPARLMLLGNLSYKDFSGLAYCGDFHRALSKQCIKKKDPADDQFVCRILIEISPRGVQRTPSNRECVISRRKQPIQQPRHPTRWPTNSSWRSWSQRRSRRPPRSPRHKDPGWQNRPSSEYASRRQP